MYKSSAADYDGTNWATLRCREEATFLAEERQGLEYGIRRIGRRSRKWLATFGKPVMSHEEELYFLLLFFSEGILNQAFPIYF